MTPQELLNRYASAKRSAIMEFSGSIDSDMRLLYAECALYAEAHGLTVERETFEDFVEGREFAARNKPAFTDNVTWLVMFIHPAQTDQDAWRVWSDGHASKFRAEEEKADGQERYPGAPFGLVKQVVHTEWVT